MGTSQAVFEGHLTGKLHLYLSNEGGAFKGTHIRTGASPVLATFCGQEMA